MSDYEGILALLGGEAVLIVVMFFFFLVAGLLTAALYIVVIKMAEDRHREVALWVLLSFVTSPLLMIIVLRVVGEEKKIE